MSLSILNKFKQSRLWAKTLDLNQKRTFKFKYWKIEPQEEMDGPAKAQQHFKKVPRKDLLAPKYRLRPWSPRYIPTEIMDFIKEPETFRTLIFGLSVVYFFIILFIEKLENEKFLLNYYHPDKDTEVRILMEGEDDVLMSYYNCGQHPELQKLSKLR